MKKIYFNLDRVKICLLQPSNFYEDLYKKYHSEKRKRIKYPGFYLSFQNEESVNDKDITASLFLNDKAPVELGTFVFNRSAKFGSKCFFIYSTKTLYQTAGYFATGKRSVQKYNYFAFTFEVFNQLRLVFNNITYLEIAADTENNVIRNVQYALKRPDIFDMVLLWKKVKSPTELLVGYYEYYQRSRLRKDTHPTIYIRDNKLQSGNRCELKIYDKAREMAQSRPDKNELIRAWTGLNNNIQRLEISIENKQFKRYFAVAQKTNLAEWDNQEHMFMSLGLDEKVRGLMFDYFSNHLLHFKQRNKDKTQVPILLLAAISNYTLINLTTDHNSKKTLGKDSR